MISKRKTVHANAPGKLFIAGEYAVVTSGQPAILVAVNRYVDVTVTGADEATIMAEGYTVAPVIWRWDADERRVLCDEVALDLVAQTMTTFYRAIGSDVQPVSVVIRSTLISDGVKIGLGSSAAVTVAVLRALALYHDVNLSPEQVYKLGVTAQYTLGLKGSGADLAVASFGGWLWYERYDVAWLAQQLDTADADELWRMPWPKLVCRALPVAETLPKLLVGWTKKAAITETAVRHIVPQHTADKARFLDSNRRIVTVIADALQHNRVEWLQEQLAAAHQLLLHYTAAHGVSYETPQLRELYEIAVRYGAAAKISGAGGGDCGIAFDCDNHQPAIEAQWRQAGIVPLVIAVVNGKGETDARQQT